MVNNPIFSENLRKLIKSGTVMTGLENILENVEKVFVVVNKDYKIIYANPYANELKVSGAKTSFSLGESIIDALGPKAWEFMETSFEQCLVGLETADIVQWEDALGRPFYLKYNLSPVTLKDKTKGLLFQASDYSEQIFIEHHVKTGNNLMDVIFRTVENSIVILNSSGSIIKSNRAFEELLGFSGEELEGRSFDELILECEDGCLDKLRRMDNCQSECSLKTKDGGRAYVRASGKLLKSQVEDFLIISLEDISRQKELENELRLSRDRLSSLVDNLSLYLWSLDTDLCFVTANKAAIDIFKKSFDYDFEPGDHIMELYHKRDQTDLVLWMAKYNAVLETRESQYFELAENFYGRFSHITVELHPIATKGKLRGISCLVRNDTNKYLKNQLNQALSNFKSRALNTTSINDLLWAVTDEILAHLHLEDAIILMRKDDTLQIKTAYGSKRVGHKRINSPLSIKIGKGVTGNVAATGESAIVNDTSNDPRYFEVHFSGGSEIVVPIKIGEEVIGVINCESSHKNFFKDIHLEILEEVAQVTAEKITQIIAERRLRKVEELNRAVLNSTPNSYMLLNAEMKIESFNRTAFKSILNFYGMEITKGTDFNSLIIPELKDEFFAHFQRALGGELTREEEFVEHPKYGGLWFSVTFAPAVNRQRKVFGVTVIMENITKSKESENLILQKNQDLIKANQELDKFVYSVSHDLRSPVSSVMGITALANHTDDIEEIRQYNNLIRESMERMDSFIHNILDYSRNSRVELKYEDVNVKALVDSILRDHSHMEGVKDIDFKLDIRLEDIRTDQQRLSIILSNLISNAVKYHDTTKQNQFIHITAESRDNIYVFKVSDNGQGIRKEHIDRLFQMFFTANLRAKGSGIGLYILKEAVENLHGTIEVDSEYGQGTEFIAKLPIPNVTTHNEILAD
ncbi:MAG TPA: hypothetical protein DDW81_18255 [Cryomorphaceae bacterium]|nr:hypothetical protein [Cryomorphaceae bacterium]